MWFTTERALAGGRDELFRFQDFEEALICVDKARNNSFELK